MQRTEVTLAGAILEARASGALHWPEENLLVVGDLHLGRSERLARQGAGLLPPYETTDTLNRLEAEILSTAPKTVVCLGDSFDDLTASRNLHTGAIEQIGRLSAGRNWIWVIGNHDPGPIELPGTTLSELTVGTVRFLHIADPTVSDPETGEVSAHYHPKARLTLRGQRITRPCFLVDRQRIILPAFGTYTGGLDARDAAFAPLLNGSVQALLLGKSITPVPLNRLR